MNEILLKDLRGVTDSPADDVVRKLIENNQLEIVNKVLFSMQHNDSSYQDLPDFVKDFIKQSSMLPNWADFNKIRKAQELYELYGLEISLILFCKSLPQSYCCPKGVKVLHATGRLSKDTSYNKFTRRVIETSQFVMNALSRNAFENDGAGIVTTIKVRLLHASIRYYLKKYNWDSSLNGEPINQEDMLGTLMSFSALVVEGLDMLNIEWTEEEKDAFIHCWNVIGYILGVQEENLPKNYKEAISSGYAIFNNQKGYSEEGQELADSLVSFIHYILPGNVFDGMAEGFISYFLGPEYISYIGMKEKDGFLEKRLPVICRTLGGASDDLKDHSGLIRMVAKPMSRMILRGILFSYNETKEVSILIPPSLKENWQLQEGWENILAGPTLLGRRLAIQKKINKFD